MYKHYQLGKYSIGAVFSVLSVTISACTDANSTASIETAVNSYCQNEQQLVLGTAEYEKCVAERTDFVVQAARRGAIF